MEALEAGDADFEFDDDESDVDWDTGEDLEVMEDTLGGLYDDSQMGLDAAVMDEVTGELPFAERFGARVTASTQGLGGTPVTAQQRVDGPKHLTKDDVTQAVNEVTEEVAQPVKPHAMPQKKSKAASAAPWVLALGGVVAIAAALLFVLVGIGLLTSGSSEPEPAVQIAAAEQVPVPVVQEPTPAEDEADAEGEGELEGEEEVVDVAAPAPIRARAPQPTPAAAPVDEAPEVVEAAPEPAPPEPISGDQGPSTDLKQKKGIFRKKK